MTLTDPARPAAKTTTRTGYNVCTICDIGCQVRTTTEHGVVTKDEQHDNQMQANNICYKRTAPPHLTTTLFLGSGRVLY